MKINNEEKLHYQELLPNELMEINGGGFWKDFGYAWGYLFGSCPDSYLDYASGRY